MASLAKPWWVDKPVTIATTYGIIAEHLKTAKQHPNANFNIIKNKKSIGNVVYPHIHPGEETLAICTCHDQSPEPETEDIHYPPKRVKPKFHRWAWGLMTTTTVVAWLLWGWPVAVMTAVMGGLFYRGAVQVKQRKFWDLVCQLGVFLFGSHGCATPEQANRVRYRGYAIRIVCTAIMTSLFVTTLIMTGGIGLALWAGLLCAFLSMVNSFGIGMSMTGNHMRATQLENTFVEGVPPKTAKDKMIFYGRRFLDVNGCLGTWVKLVCLLSLIPGISLLHTATVITLLWIDRVSSLISTGGIMLMTKIRFNRLKEMSLVFSEVGREAGGFCNNLPLCHVTPLPQNGEPGRSTPSISLRR